MKGTIKKLIRERGFGFINTEDGREIFFHTTALQGMTFAALVEGQPVEFDIEKSSNDPRSKGPRALNVQGVKQD